MIDVFERDDSRVFPFGFHGRSLNAGGQFEQYGKGRMIEDETVSLIVVDVGASGNRHADHEIRRPIVELLVPRSNVDLNSDSG